MLALLLFFVFSPAGLEIAHAASHAVSGDSHLHAHGGKVHRHAHGAGHHALLPDGASTDSLQDAAPGFEAAAAAATPSLPPPSEVFRTRKTLTAAPRLAVNTNGPCPGRSPPA